MKKLGNLFSIFRTAQLRGPEDVHLDQLGFENMDEDKADLEALIAEEKETIVSNYVSSREFIASLPPLQFKPHQDRDEKFRELYERVNVLESYIKENI